LFGVHAPELILLLIVALVIFGPKRLPEIGGSLGKGIREFRKSTQEPPELDDKARSSDVHIPDQSVHDVTAAERNVTPVSSTPRDRDAG